MSEEYPTSHANEFARLERRAVMQGWYISDDQKDEIVKRQFEIATSADSSARDATRAARCLIAMEGQNIQIALSPAINLESTKLEPVSTTDLLLAMRQATIPDSPN